MTDDDRPTLERAIPVLASLDIAATHRFYVDRLRFEVIAAHDDYGVVARDGIEVHHWLTVDPEIPRATSCRIDVVGVDALHHEMVAAGVVHPEGSLADQPWGFRQFSITDGDGNLVTFGERIGE